MKKPGTIFKCFNLSVFLTIILFFAGEADVSAKTKPWPSGPVTLVSSSRAGGFSDTHARILSDYLQRKTGEAVTVMNVPGGGGTSGAEKVRRSKPDGRTLYYFHTSFPISCYTGIYNRDPDEDFTAVSSVVGGGYVAIVVRTESPWKSLDELVADARKRPEEIMWGTRPAGTTHFMLALLEREADVKFRMVDAGGNAQKITTLLGGHIDVTTVGLRNADQYDKAGKMRVLGVIGAGAERDVTYDQYPTTVELGYKTVVWTGEFTLYGPKGIPDEIVAQINDALDDFGITDEKSRQDLKKMGTAVVPRSTEASIALIRKTHQDLKDIAKDLGFIE